MDVSILHLKCENVLEREPFRVLLPMFRHVVPLN